MVVAGGDGTIREAASALAGRRIPLAIVPGGTGNVLASSLGLGSVRAAVDAIRHGRERTIDLGSARWGPMTPDAANPHARACSWSACGMGLDAKIMAAAQHEWKRRMRFGAYVGAAIGELHRLTTAVFRIVADGKELEIRGYLVLLVNTGDIIPGRVGPRRPLDPADGHLELIVLGADHPFDGLRAAAGAPPEPRRTGRARHPPIGRRGSGRGGPGPADPGRRRRRATRLARGAGVARSADGARAGRSRPWQTQ